MLGDVTTDVWMLVVVDVTGVVMTELPELIVVVFTGVSVALE